MHPDLPTPAREDLQDLLERTCPFLGRLPSELTGTSRHRSISLARRRFVFIAVSHFGHQGTAVARGLAKSPSQVSRWLAAQTEAYTIDPGEASFIDQTVVKLLIRGEGVRHN